jgi:hypothetical protein
MEDLVKRREKDRLQDRLAAAFCGVGSSTDHALP